ncbi:ATP-binding response regulator [Allorhodopirellula heiligendammensis]|uniref:Chemotaxis protein CheY n=1 Tax=Allorhodopirellula heiligendammensis TaxID=2714739 RepID=A0A5C6C978_9BACT|nr:response regulator [Allorhodopirellula heiligendammensis]TWU19319.1 Chemotaxis protein CheY [Allorhodopirellula heiligendammensis]|tara:strand:+ start:91 stop:1008 length:918 start_codon:yes stop_codon:yes gene_type:complete
MARILLVEDSPTQAAQIRILLEAANHDVGHALNGRLALEELHSRSFDIVVTDLEMPELNGLQLVEQMRDDFSHVPSILVTGHGSEELAAEALQLGAAGYVPKNRIDEMLNNTIVDVLGVIRTDASYAKLISTLRKNVFIFELPNDPMLISPLVGLLMQVSSGMELLPSIDMVRLGVAVEHAVANAMVHGNLQIPLDQCPSHHDLARYGEMSPAMQQRIKESPYCDRTVRVEAIAQTDQVRVIVTDQGDGFDTTTVPKKGQFDPKSLSEDCEAPHGQGFILMTSFVDELVYNEKGNQVTLVKRCRV